MHWPDELCTLVTLASVCATRAARAADVLKDSSMKCAQCGNAKFRRATEKHYVNVAKTRFVADLPVTVCRKCGESYMEHKILSDFERRVARHLAENGPATGETFRFMRKAIGLPALEVAKLLGTTPETVSRWESGTHRPDAGTWTTLGSLVLDELGGRSDVRKRLQALKAKWPARPKPVHVTLEAR
jgi:putative zinc finger/helix-turn-helix YgiT family protein